MIKENILYVPQKLLRGRMDADPALSGHRVNENIQEALAISNQAVQLLYQLRKLGTTPNRLLNPLNDLPRVDIGIYTLRKA
ncbi:hypothetical protein TO73_2843 (plasmid) [Thermus aquaticus Y51MC23]|uniref:Uncharacterized protein n=1 Tax=Thermus aquaticus (strain ATCC BAA-2747 / Y51MC23) TaxID=498848 RepID=A0ABM5VQB5_THEA5|nr:hypothetical protein TO73_2843 [Thermus aquaticus Y51MC23]